MNEQQFEMVANKALRKPLQRKAVHSVIFEGLSCYEAERKFNCSAGTIHRSYEAVKNHFDHCVAVASAK